jgi:hypothetical protein
MKIPFCRIPFQLQHTRKMTYNYNDQYGTAIAKKLAEKFWANQVRQFYKDDFGIYYSHQAYCGHGLGWVNGNLMICEVYDGGLMPPPKMMWTPNEKDKFIRWMSVQSDAKLAGYDESAWGFYTDDKWNRGNQRLCLSRFEAFLDGKEGH